MKLISDCFFMYKLWVERFNVNIFFKVLLRGFFDVNKFKFLFY